MGSYIAVSLLALLVRQSLSRWTSNIFETFIQLNSCCRGFIRSLSTCDEGWEVELAAFEAESGTRFAWTSLSFARTWISRWDAFVWFVWWCDMVLSLRLMAKDGWSVSEPINKLFSPSSSLIYIPPTLLIAAYHHHNNLHGRAMGAVPSESIIDPRHRGLIVGP
jgi:hypothetical protein